MDDATLLRVLPAQLADVLRQVNGFILHGGAFHLRGVCSGPFWHSLRAALDGPLAFHHLYPAVQASDIPFGEDCMGDQFLLRDAMVVRLLAETGDIQPAHVDLSEFLKRAETEPLEFLRMHPLLQYERDGGVLAPGQLLAAYPPFFAQEAGEGVTLRAISTEERRPFLADVARQVRDLPDGARITFVVEALSNGRPTKR
jgi:hypothetical protein